MKIKWSVLIYSSICNIPVCFFLCLNSALLANTDIESGVLTMNLYKIDWASIGINFAIAYILAMIIGYFVPLTTIGRWFTHLFKVKNDTYTGNVPYRLLATLISSLIFYIGITPVLTLFNYFVFKSMTIGQALLNMAIQAPLMLLVGFVSSLISDIFAFKVAHHYDPTF